MPDVYLQALSSRVSDHSPLLLVGNATVKKFRGFRFEAFWPQLQGFQEVVHEVWIRDLQIVNPFLRLHTKLQRTSKVLRHWAKGIVGNTKVLICAVAMLIAVLDVVQEFRNLNEIEIRLRRDLKMRYLALTAVDKLRAKQASRLSNIKATESSAKLFFMHANGRRRKNVIHCLHEGSRILFAQEEKEQVVF